MYERSRRSANNATNSWRSAAVRGGQCRASDRLAVSPKSKMLLAILRTAARRSLALLAFFSSGSSRTLRTRSMWVRSWSVGWPARASAGARSSATAAANTRPRRGVMDDLLDLPEDVLGEELLEVDGRFDLPDPAVRWDDLLRAARADAQVFLADEPFRLDRGDGIVLQLHARVDPERHARLIVGETDRLDAPDLDPGDLDGRSGLEPAHRGEIGRDAVPGGSEERDPPELDGQVPEGQDAEQHEEPHGDVDARSLHQRPSTFSGSPRMN